MHAEERERSSIGERLWPTGSERPVCDVCQTGPVAVLNGCVEMCAPCAVDEIERHVDDLDTENHLGRDLTLTADELLEHGIALR